MSEKNAPGHDSGSEALTETPEVPAVPEVAGTPVRPELRLEVIAAPTGQFGASDAGDTTGYGEHRSVVTLAPAAARPYGGWFDDVVDALIEDLQEAGTDPAAAIEKVVSSTTSSPCSSPASTYSTSPAPCATTRTCASSCAWASAASTTPSWPGASCTPASSS